MDLLRRKSEQRRNGDAAFQKREELLHRIRERTNANMISLNFEERLAMARADRVLNDEQRALMGADAEDDEAPGQDAVLLEALRVLSDICLWRDTLRGSAPKEEALAEAA